MSKESFSRKISETMYKKIAAIEHFDIKTLLEKDEYFEIAICLAYLSLTKEKIIEKDIKNNNRISRLNQKVDTIEINKTFQPEFSKKMPKIIYARENNNLWILDNIRDSIMHGACDIDEEKKHFIINNTQYDRELKAEIPFDWIISYAKNDILSKKLANKYTIRSYYYNKSKKQKMHLETNKELSDNILYKVNIYGNRFNVATIKNRIAELFLLYSKDEISDEIIKEYKVKNKEKKYNKKYLVSFYIASQKVINTINKEFKDVKVKISIENNDKKIINKIEKQMPKYFTNYDIMFNIFNNTISPKGITLLRFFSNLIENSFEEYKDNLDWKKATIILHKMLTNENIAADKKNNLSLILKQDLKILQSIYLNIYGLSTLVINHQTIYNKHLLNKNPAEFGIQAHLKSLYSEYAIKQKSLIMKELEIQILLANKKEQLNKCNNIEAKKKIQTLINNLNTSLVSIQNNLKSLTNNMNFDKVIKYNDIDYKKMKKLHYTINKYFINFDATNNIEAKKKIKKIISRLLDKEIEESLKYTYGYCNNMQDTLTIIRNCFSHIGRINIKNNNIILNDYDTNGEKSGEVICKYMTLIELLNNPYEVKKETKQYTNTRKISI